MIMKRRRRLTVRTFIVISIFVLVFIISEFFFAKIEFIDKTREQIRKEALVEEIIQNAISNISFVAGSTVQSDGKLFKGIIIKNNLDVAESQFRKATMLAPSRLDIKFDLATTEILQGKIKEALTTYENIIYQSPHSFNALMLFAVYSKQLGKNEVYDSYIKKLQREYPEKLKTFISALDRTEKILNFKLKASAEKLNLKDHIIIVFGYPLDYNGEPESELIGRLEQTLKLYHLNPDSSIIVTGGVPRAGVTEAYVMKNWLVTKGVPIANIYLDDRSDDIVENGLNSAKILKMLRANNVTLVTGASYAYGALAVLTEACVKENLDVKLNNLVYLNSSSELMKNISEQEKIFIFKDLMRTCGIWAYPGIQQ